MAEAFFNRYSKKHTSESAGVVLDIDYIDKRVLRAMDEIGFDLSYKKPREVTEEMINNSDKVILISPDLEQYYSWSKKPVVWNITDVVKDTNGQVSYQQFINVREKVKAKIKGLVRELG